MPPALVNLLAEGLELDLTASARGSTRWAGSICLSGLRSRLRMTVLAPGRRLCPGLSGAVGGGCPAVTRVAQIRK